jgi:ornithine carbamoyltransferase
MSAHLLEIDDLDPTRLLRLLETAAAWKTDRSLVPTPLAGHGAALVFEKPSARTRASTEMAVVNLGGHNIYIRDEEVGLDTRETVEDVARTLACYCSVIAARTFKHETLERIVSVVDVPVVNLLSDAAHPTQAIADLITLHEHWGTLEGRRLAYIGDGNNTAASLAYACAFAGVDFAIASPPGYELPEPIAERVRNLGGTVEQVTDPYDAVDGADALYTDVWTSMGQEAEREARRAVFARYQIDATLLAAALPEAVFLHCLPAHRGEEVTAEVIDGPRSLVWQQAANRMHSARVVIAELLGALPSDEVPR